MNELFELLGIKTNKKGEEKKPLSAKQKIVVYGLIPVILAILLALFFGNGYTSFFNRQNITKMNFSLLKKCNLTNAG